MMQTPQKISITDVTTLPRFGMKGINAQSWLAAQGLQLPAALNSWEISAESYLVLRLGASEYLIESLAEQYLDLFKQASQQKNDGVYYVPRADASFLLAGHAVPELLSEICMLDLRELPNSQALLMTQVANVNAVLIKQTVAPQQVYRLWCDATYHRYMHETLTTIAQDIAAHELASI